MRLAVAALLVVLVAWGCGTPFVRSAFEGGVRPDPEAEDAYVDWSAEAEVKALLWDPPQMRLAYPVVRVIERSPCPEPHTEYGGEKLTHSRIIRAYGLFGGHRDFQQTCEDGPELAP